MDTKRLSAGVLGLLMVGGSAAGVLAVMGGGDETTDPVVTEYVVEEVRATSPQAGVGPSRSLVASGVDSRDSYDSYDSYGSDEEDDDDDYEDHDREGDDDDD